MRGENFATLVVALCENLGYGKYNRSQIAELACQLVSISRGLFNLAVKESNGELDKNSWTTKHAHLSRKADSILPNEIQQVFKSDPRAGYGLGLIFPDKRTNDFGGTCIIVPCKVTD